MPAALRRLPPVFSLVLLLPLLIPLGRGWGLDPTAITPGEASVTFESNTIQQVTFTVWNNGGATKTPTLTCGATGALTCLSVAPATPTLAPWSDTDITVTFRVGTGTLTLSSSDGGSGHYLVNGDSGTAPTVTLVVPAVTAGNRALVRNRQPLIRALFSNGSTVDTAATLLRWRGDTVTALARQNRRLLEWDVDSTRWLNLGDSAQVEVRACSMGGACNTVIRWAVLPADSTPAVGFSSIPLEALGAGFSSPFGPGLAVSGAEVETGFATVPYISMNTPRGTGLVYSTRQSYPRVLLPVDVDIPDAMSPPATLKVVAIDGTTRMDSVVLSSPSCATAGAKRCRTVLQPDFASQTFSAPTRKWLKVEVSVTKGAVTKAGVDSVEVALVDRRTTPYGSGWWPTAGVQLAAAGGDRLLVAPNGSVTVFRGTGDSLYLAPPGSFALLTRTGTGWELTARGSLGKSVFDSQGRLVATIDPNGNRDSIFYNGTVAAQIDSLKDPKGKKISFTYTSGKLAKITSLPGTPGERETRITVDGNGRLVYDSLSSPSARPALTTYVYKAYADSSTVVLTKRIGVLQDTTIVTYDSTFRRRPVSSRLPRVEDETNAVITPVITYTAMEKQGYGSVRSLDSIYVEMKDPRNFWTRSLLNRWGQARRSWDSLGVLSRAAYDQNGFPLWAEGKVADSSRTYTAYDRLMRPVKSYIIRATGDTLRGDSLVYDANHWVVQRIDNRGKVWTTAYSATGLVTQTITPTGDTTRYSYFSNGTLWRLTPPGNVPSEFQQFAYDTVWGNMREQTGELGNLLGRTVFDRFGRDSVSETKVAVQANGSTPQWQWRKTMIYWNAANRVDSTRLQRTDNCADPCSGPWYGSTDTLHLIPLRHVYDRAGRDSLRTNERGTKTEYLYDRLGRLRVRRPWTDSAGVMDSMFYDAAGNLKKTRTRRGNVITTNYDSRNRDTLTTVPGVGTIRKTYGGPLDQLTRLWNSAPVDSIGGVNGEARFGFDQRGRLKVDTVYTGTTARSTTYTYDTWERPSTLTDVQGTWSNRYETNRGLADTLITPYGDTAVYVFDAKGRASGPTIMFGDPSRILTTSTYYLPNDQLDSTVMKMGATVLSRWQRKAGGGQYGAALKPSWTDPLGRLWQDSVQYDGWERVTNWVATVDGNEPGIRDTMLFDQTGNVNIRGMTSLTSDPITSQLTTYKTGGHSYAYTYDFAGNVVGIKDSTFGQAGPRIWTFGYDGLERLVSVRRSDYFSGDSAVARYAYDLLGNRIAKRVYSSVTGGTVAYTRFVYHGSQVAFETDSTGTIGLAYTWGPGTDNLMAVRTAGGAIHAYAVTDRLGSVRGLVKRDGTLLYTFGYRPYGEVADSTGSGGLALRYRWTGREYDPETGWYFMRARYYDPKARRFMSEDPIGFEGGRNVYAYLDGAVLDGRDPTGHGAAPDAFGEVNERLQEYLQGQSAMYKGLGGTAIYLNGVPMNAGVRGLTAEDFAGTVSSIWGRGSTLLPPRTRKMSDKERIRLAPLCREIISGCNSITIITAGGNWNTVMMFSPGGFAAGHYIFAGREPRQEGWLAHELTHVVQFDKWGDGDYLWQGAKEHLFGKGEGYFPPPDYGASTGGFWSMGMEQQATTVQRCFAQGDVHACDASPFKPEY